MLEKSTNAICGVTLSLLLLQGDGDIVTASVLRDREGFVAIESITGDGGRLPLNPGRNCVGVAAYKTLELIGKPACGVSLSLQKVSGIQHCEQLSWRKYLKACAA